MNTTNILADLRAERARLDRAIAAIEAISSDGARRPGRKPAAAAPRRRSRMGAAARRKLSAMMKARWAERRKSQSK